MFAVHSGIHNQLFGKPLCAENDNNRFQSIYYPMKAQTLLLRIKLVFEHKYLHMFDSKIKQIEVIFTNLKLCLATATHNFKCVKI